MEFFVLERDKRLDHLAGGLVCSARLEQGYEAAEDNELVEVHGEGARDYGCMLEQPTLLVTSELRMLLTKYDSQMAYKTVSIIDKNFNGLQLNYFLINMREVDVMDAIPPDVLKRSKAALGFRIRRGDVPECPFFGMTYYRKKYLVVRLDVAEHVLRAGLYGVAVKRLQLKECD
ncbi:MULTISPECIES: hypothetical protein [Paenibacillus]|uniref:hypothetical protein n=1 Tax=Paenibacillus TaxID=44249 RepID=UPI002FE0DDF8